MHGAIPEITRRWCVIAVAALVLVVVGCSESRDLQKSTDESSTSSAQPSKPADPSVPEAVENPPPTGAEPPLPQSPDKSVALPPRAPRSRFHEDSADSATAPRDKSLADDPVREDAADVRQVDRSAATGEPADNGAAAKKSTSDQPFELVTVFYATDRKRLDEPADVRVAGRVSRVLLVGAAAVVLLVIVGVIGRQRRRMFTLAGLAGVLTVGWGIYAGRQQLADYRAAAQRGARYGNERGQLEVGTCQVSIPWVHEVGALEQPSLLRLEVREDVRRHVVLHETTCQEEEAFYRQLRDTVAAAPRAEVFVFVHGYNVTFEGAARRTAQIAYDVQFAGAPIFFSWPSQGGLLKYTVDENNVEWAVPHLKQLLLDVVRRSGAKNVNLIAHSMGNRALGAALRELRRELDTESALFNQIILAAPDIDAEIFCRDVAPTLSSASKRVTLYASSNDQALVASKRVHGYARAGDSGGDLVVVPGVETIDVSVLNTSLLGHSYYGTSNPVLLDIRQLMELALPAAKRQWLIPQPHGNLTYWLLTTDL